MTIMQIGRISPSIWGQALILNERIQSLPKLRSSLIRAKRYLNKKAKDTPYVEFEHKFQEMGLEKGWGVMTSHCSGIIYGPNKDGCPMSI